MLDKFELTQSSLKDWDNFEDKELWKNKWIYRQRPYDRNNSFIFGSLLDSWLFDQDNLVKRFKTYRGPCKVSESLQSIIGLVVLKLDKTDLKTAILESCKELQYGKTWKDDTILKRFDGLDDYIDFCYKHKNKIVIYPEIALETRKLANHLINHEPNQIRNYILANPSEDYKNTFQETIRGNILGVPCKVILDINHYDEINSTKRVIDFKTTYDVSNFRETIIKYGYDTQVSFYDEIVKQNPDPYYTVLPPMNVIVAKKDLDILVYEYTEWELESSKIRWMKTVKEIAAYLEQLKNEKK